MRKASIDFHCEHGGEGEITASASHHVADSSLNRDLTFLKIEDVTFFGRHWQMVSLRDALTKIISESPFRCACLGCEEQAARTCESCDKRYCEEHCSKGGAAKAAQTPMAHPTELTRFRRNACAAPAKKQLSGGQANG